MKRVLLLGVGRSTHTLIKYLVDYSKKLNIHIFLADQKKNDFIAPYIHNNSCTFISLDINHPPSRKKIISNSDIVISMLPPRFHFMVAKDCVELQKNLITASYVSEDIAKLDAPAKKANIIILNEMGLDPGIDHLSAMDIIDSLKEKGAVINIFKSFCGGLIAPESDNNPWNYKFTWNPKNVVLAGQAGASYLKKGAIKTLKYDEIFSNIEKVTIPNYGEFESYANRDSLHYKNKYNLIDAHTIVRGTLRKAGFSAAWNVFVQLGMTSEDSVQKINKDKFCQYLKRLNNADIDKKMDYLDLFNDELLNSDYQNPAQYLLEVLRKKWSLDANDKDMIVMQHKFEYFLDNEKHNLKLSMVVKGYDSIQTGMAKTVGLPVFFACKLLLEEKLQLKGVRIPIYPEIYKPILQQLYQEGIQFLRS